MPLFRYEALDKSGSLKRGAMDASDEQAVANRLAQMGFRVQAIYPPAGRPDKPAKPSVPVQAAAIAAGASATAYYTSSLALKEQVVFWRQLSELLGSGISPYQAFQSLSGRASGGKLRHACQQAAEAIQNGKPMAEAMRVNQDLFGTEYRVAIMAGELGGFLPQVVNDIAVGIEEEYKGRLQYGCLKLLIRLNTFGVIAVVSLVIFMSNWIGGFKEIEAIGSGLGAHMRTGFFSWLRRFLLLELPILGGIYWGIPIFLGWVERGPWRPFADALTFRTPVLSGLKQTRLRHRFFRLLARMMSAGVPPMVAWDAATDGVGHHQFAQAASLGRDEIGAGNGFGAAASRAGVFPNDDIYRLQTGEQAGRIPDAAESLAQQYDAQVKGQRKVLNILSVAALLILNAVVTIYVWYLIGTWWASLPLDLLKEMDM